ncbi:MAG: hypothetical protein Q9219_001207 [cf. Caloplaca sp. 3 TL-2023]
MGNQGHAFLDYGELFGSLIACQDCIVSGSHGDFVRGEGKREILLGCMGVGGVIHAWVMGRCLDVPSLIKYSSGTSYPVPIHRRTYTLASTLTGPLLISLLFFWVLTFGRPSSVLAWDIIPQLYLLFLLLFFLIPHKRLSPSGRARFLVTLLRISVGSIAEAQDGKFGDILLADALTSYAKVLGDVFVSGCMFFTKGKSSTGRPDRACGGEWVVPVVIAVPYAIRLRQCLTEYYRVRRSPRRGQQQGWGGQHLANAAKYASAFPVVVFSALQRGHDPEWFWLSEKGLYRLWLLSILLNSLYSFYWDIAKDWDLTFFSSLRALFSSSSSSSSPMSPTSPFSPRHHPTHLSSPTSPFPSSSYPFGLRPQTHIHSPALYYIAIALDFLLRLTWSLKLSPHLVHWNGLEGSVFLLEIAEVGRRWVWIFFRVEAEWVRGRSMGVGIEGPEEWVLGELPR